MIEIENEIDALEGALDYLEMAISDIKDSPYHSYLADSWGLDAEEIKARLEELYESQNEYWAEEMKQQNFEFEEMRL